MTQAIHPLEATDRIADDYIRYLRTIYFFNNPHLREQLAHALGEERLLVRGPILEASPPFKLGRSIQQLVEARVLHPSFETLCSPALPYERPLYRHQDQALTRVAQGRNVVVATGTGSGKTESFLVPIFDHLLREQAAGTLDQPGVRALLLYPMNALANDQLRRLRRLLKRFPQISFGRYTGETLAKRSDAVNRFHQQFRGDPLLPNERLSREEMQAQPPHILMTNYAMLEYLLLRPADCEFFDGPQGQFWRFIVLDEAHIYDGAQGIEVAMLLRRLRDRVAQSEPGRLRYIATSATLGKSAEDFGKVAHFASELFGAPFEWVEDDPARQDVVAGEREPMSAFGAPWGQGSAVLYAALERAAAERQPVASLAALAQEHAVPASVVTQALSAAQSVRRDDDGQAEATNRFLYQVLQGDRRLHRLRGRLEEPVRLRQLATELTDAGEPDDTIVHLVRLAVRARPHPEAVSLLPARYHVFVRALEGAFVCLNHDHPAHKEQGQPSLFLRRYEVCPACKSAVFELATCPRCGTAYIVGREEPADAASGGAGVVLRHPPLTTDESGATLAYFALTHHVQEMDEDEAVAADENVDNLDPALVEDYELCRQCGAVGAKADGGAGCGCGQAARVTVKRVSRGGQPRECAGCGARRPNGAVYRFLTGQDAPVSVLATSLYQLLPPSDDDDARDLPGEGRKLLVFADSRQDAAFFAPYLERTYQQLLRRRVIMKVLTENKTAREGELRLDDLVKPVVNAAKQAGFFTQRQGDETRRILARTWLMQELVALDSRIGLEGLGLLHFRLVRPDRWRPPQCLLDAPWNLDPDEAWAVLESLVTTLRQQAALTFPENVDPTDAAFAPRNREYYVARVAVPKRPILGWLPKRGSNRRLDYLARLLQRRAGLSEAEAKPQAKATLAALWDHLTQPASVWREHLPVVSLGKDGDAHRLDHAFWEWDPVAVTGRPVYRCDRCFNVAYTNVAGVCPANGCDGRLVEVAPGDTWEGNHYRQLYESLLPIPLQAEEHTAQWTSEEAPKVQQRFISGEINVLSCSTTFELGVDVGVLQAVLMRNVPPTTANYVQRAGRAGRRTESVAFVLTYAQRRSHDLSHFKEPTRLVSGQVEPPVLAVSNEKIVRRHAHSVCLAAFLRWAKDRHGRTFRSVGEFFTPDPAGVSGGDLLQTYLAARPADVQAALRRVVPAEVAPTMALDTWGWLPALTNAEASGVLDLAASEVRQDLQLYADLEAEASRNREHGRAKYYQDVAATVRGRDLLGFLGARNVLPKYGFPTDVVELRTEHVGGEEAKRVALDRDLRVAISEYAPGSEVVAAKRVWRGGGLYLMPNKKLPPVHYAVCPDCGRFHRSQDEEPQVCKACGASLHGGRVRRYGEFVVPEFGFVAERDTTPTGEGRPQRIYSSRVYFADYGPSDGRGETGLESVAELSDGPVKIARRYSRFGKLAVVNSGIDNMGFAVCPGCGWAKPYPLAAKDKKGHADPRTGRPCKGRTTTYHLGHEFMTDVLELRFSGSVPNPQDDPVWRSTLYALLEGASSALNIARDDLDGVLYRDPAYLPPALVLYDNVPGGAGHVQRLCTPDALRAVLDAAHERVRDCQDCGEETSCYGCLRNFYNQYYHDQLKRGAARDFLAGVLQREPGLVMA